jgi:hypothetical protein
MRNILLALAPLWFAPLLVASATAQEPANWADKLFEGNLAHDFGIVAHGALLKHTFKITNIYKVPLDITEVKGSCGCVRGEVSAKTLQPGATAMLNVTMDARTFTGAKSAKIYVNVGPKFLSMATLTLSANARGDIAFSPSELDFGNLQRGQTPSKSIDVEYTGAAADWKVVEILKSAAAPFELKVEELPRLANAPPRRGYRLVATLKADAATGSFKQEVMLKTNNAAAPMVTFNVVGSIQAGLSVSPNPVVVSGMKVDESQTKKVFVRAAKAFKIVSIDGQGDGIKVEIPNGQEATQVLNVQIQATKAGPLRRQLLIRTDLDSEVTTLTIEGTIAP